MKINFEFKISRIIDKAFPFCIPPLKDKSVLVAVHHVL